MQCWLHCPLADCLAHLVSAQRGRRRRVSEADAWVVDGGAVVARSASDWVSWRRWWCPADEDPPVSSGFLDDPAGPFATYFVFSLVELTQVDHVRILVLVDESCLGQSSVLDVAVKSQR